jgi:hypothetical protein
LDEDSGAVSPYASTCSCFGVFSCESDDCNGNQCVLSTRDMKKHCKYADEGLFEGGTCSNCRQSDDACKAYGGQDPSKVDTSSIGISAGVVGFACVGLVGGVVMKRKRTREASKADPMKAVEMGNQDASSML